MTANNVFAFIEAAARNNAPIKKESEKKNSQLNADSFANNCSHDHGQRDDNLGSVQRIETNESNSVSFSSEPGLISDNVNRTVCDIPFRDSISDIATGFTTVPVTGKSSSSTQLTIKLPQDFDEHPLKVEIKKSNRLDEMLLFLENDRKKLHVQKYSVKDTAGPKEDMQKEFLRSARFYGAFWTIPKQLNLSIFGIKNSLAEIDDINHR